MLIHLAGHASSLYEGNGTSILTDSYDPHDSGLKHDQCREGEFLRCTRLLLTFSDAVIRDGIFKTLDPHGGPMEPLCQPTISGAMRNT